MNLNKVRVRFAPSPTGYLHVGGVRTALFNWLYARSNQGEFILRIEDTDQKRSTEEAVAAILEGMQWLGLDWDTGPVLQSERLDIYHDYAGRLLEDGQAYRTSRPKKVTDFAGEDYSASVSAEQIPGEVIVFKSTHKNISIEDRVHGRIEFDSSLIDDFVIVKSDGMPTYNFACVVDDALMKISHVIRGDDHISNTPKQIMLYQALRFPLPVFAHVPMILGPDGTRLSKRHGATSINEYRQQGFLPQAMLNFLALLGWSPGADREIISLDEIIQCFRLERITGKSAVFNVTKLAWMNGVYISRLSASELVSFCRPFLLDAGLLKEKGDSERLAQIVPLFRERIKQFNEIAAATKYFFEDEIDFPEDIADKFLKTERAVEILTETKKILTAIDDFNQIKIEEKIRDLVTKSGLKTKLVMQTIRAGVTGRIASAGIFETIVAMGRERVLRHLVQAIERGKKKK